MKGTVLITGASGMVGRALIPLLIQNGYQVTTLSTSRNDPAKGIFNWNIAEMTLDEEAIRTADFIVHLAGAPVADKKWTKNRKKTIIDSRVESVNLLRQAIEKQEKKPKAFISASGSGYYGSDTGSLWMSEGNRFGDDFLANVSKDWEDAADEMSSEGLRIVKFRIPMVLGHGGALKELNKTVSLGLGAALGTGRQYWSWVHSNDLARMFMMAIENETMNGVFNAGCSKPLSNHEFMKTLAKSRRRPYFLPPIPIFIIKRIMGERASMVLGSSRLSPTKIEKEGFKFEFSNLEDALQNLTNKGQ